MSNVAVTFSGSFTWMQMRHRRIHGGKVLLHHRIAALAVGLLDRLLDLLQSPRRCGSTPLMAKKQVCMIVLMRLPIPASRATV